MLVTIKTPQRSFVTNPDHWVGKSLYFDRLFSGHWGDRQEDDPYLIETDANIFEHILRYLRTNVLPVFYDRLAGHDYSLYQALLVEAKYFAIDRLEKWLCERKYLDAVKIHYLATETQNREEYSSDTRCDRNGRPFMREDRFVEMSLSSNMDATLIPVTQKRNSFYCPDARHGRSSPQYCRSCIDSAQSMGALDMGGWREEDQLRWCIVRKEVIFDHSLCVNAFLEDS